LLAMLVFGCSLVSNHQHQRKINNQLNRRPPTNEPNKPKPPSGALQVGEASGSYTAKGETVQLRYAYAGHANALA